MKLLKSNSEAGWDFHNLNAIVFYVLYPGIGVSYALAIIVSPPSQTLLSTPWSHTFLTKP